VAHTLLLADDSVTIQRVIELTFADEDVNVVAVSDGDQAIQRIDQSPPDIVLADVGMPGRNGYEVAQHVKHTPKLSHIPVVLLTGAFEPVDQARAAEARCDGVLAKPFEPQLVIARVRELLAKSPAASPAAPASHDVHTQIDQVPPQGDDLHHQIEEASTGANANRDAGPSIEDYFDRLDAAFASLGSTAAKPPAAEPPHAVPTPVAHAAPPPSDSQAQPPAEERQATAHHDAPGGLPDIDWFGAAATSAAPAPEPWHPPSPPVDAIQPPDAEHFDVSPSYASPAPATPDVPVVHAVPDAPVIPVIPVVPVIDDVPAQDRATQGVGVQPPASPAARKELPLLEDAFAALLAAEQAEAPASAPAWPATLPSADELAERVARMVLERLSDRAVKEAVAEIVSQTAERLVRDEIDRIKAALK
jgi:CheY-like chemotaxis protein